ncbi:MAG: PAS domain S-box protein, partial [Rhodothermaceae bacterium]
MKKHSDTESWEIQRKKIIGLGEKSGRKSYYPELQNKMSDLEKFSILFNKISDGVFLVKLPSLVIEDANKSGCRMLNSPIEDLIGSKFYNFLDSDIKYRLKELAASESYKVSPHNFSVETIVYPSSNNFVPVEMSIDIKEQDDEYFALILVKNITEKKLTEKNLWVEKKFKNLIIENAGYAIIATDSKGLITLFNKAAETLLGYNAEELIGKLTPLVFHDIDEVMYRAIEFSNSLDRKVTIGFEVFVVKTNMNLPNEHEWTFITKDKRKKRVLLNVTPVVDQENNITGYIFQAMDLTQLKEAEKDLQTIASHVSHQTGIRFFNSMAEYLGNLMDVDFVVISRFAQEKAKMYTLSVWNNNRFLKNYSYDIKGTPCQRVITTRQEYFSNDIQSEFPENESFRKRNINSYLSVPLFNSEKELIGIIMLLNTKKIIDSRRSSSIIQIFASRSSSELERIMAESDLIKAKEEAEIADRLKSEFLAQMSHEIRTPINSILNFTGLIKEEVYGTSSEDVQTSFNIIDNSGKRLIKTIDSILQMAQIQINSLEVFPKIIDLNEILEKLYQENKPEALNKNLELILLLNAKNSLIHADEHTVTQLFENLINNAIKYTEQGSVKVITKNNGESLIIDIIDTGIGISEEYKDKLFSAFTQEEQGYTRKFEGNGLGLALVNTYCKVNG